MLHAAETWAMKVDTLNRLRSNDRAMIRWICNVRAKDEVSSWMDELGFYIPSTVFQSFRDDGRVNMKGSVQ